MCVVGLLLRCISGCCAALCHGNCDPGTVPDSYQMDVSGFTDLGTCSSCSELDGSYAVGPLTTGPGDNCRWDNNSIGSLSTCNYGIAFMLINSTFAITAHMVRTDLLASNTFAKLIGTVDCRFVSESFAFSSQNSNDPVISANCDARTATCLVTAL